MQRKGYIVCIDDEESVVVTLKQQLDEVFDETHEVLTCLSGEEALELIDAIQNDGELVELVITDQIMPGLAGDEFLKKLHSRYPDIVKILLTGQAGLDSAISAINEGGLSRYYEKPWNIETMSKDLKTLIHKFRENVENRYLLNNLEKRIAELEGRA